MHNTQTIQKTIEKLTPQDREIYEKEENRIKLQKLKEAKEDLWKLRGREKKLGKEEPEMILKIKEMIRKGERITEMLRKERERVENEKQEENEKKENLRKEKEKKDKLIEKKEKLKQYWAMHKWITGYITDNKENWEITRKEQLENSRKESEDYEKLLRFKKIEKLKEKYKKKENETINKTTPNNKQDQWTKWREQENTNKQEMIEEIEEYADMTLTEENPEYEQDIAKLADWLEEQGRKDKNTKENQTRWDEQDEVLEQELFQIAEQLEKEKKVSQPDLNTTERETNKTRRKPEKPEKQLTMEDFIFKKQEIPENKRQETPKHTEKPTPKVQKPTPKLHKQETRPKLSTSMKPDSEKKKKENSKKRIKQEQEKKTIKQLQTFWNKFAESHSSTKKSISTSQEGYDTISVHQGNQASRPNAGRVTQLRIGQTENQNSGTNSNSTANTDIADLHLESINLVKTRSQPRGLESLEKES